MGSIVYSDRKFLKIIYGQHNDSFTDYTKYRDADDETRNNIYHFIDSTEKTAIAVDCESPLDLTHKIYETKWRTSMKIATWNVERLKHRKSLAEIIAACEYTQADILILTENDEAIKPKYQNCCHTPTPPPLLLQGYDMPITYAPTEHRVSIYTNYKMVRQYTTFDRYTDFCLALETEKGNILVYGTMIGIVGNRHPSFEADLIKQIEDFRRFTAAGHNLCICGDYNCSFSDNYYFTNSRRERIVSSFSECNITH